AYVGGDFGGKGLSVDEYPCYFLARATKRPIKYVRTYLEDMRSGTVRHASRTRLRTGVTADGRITAVDAKIVFNGGAYAAGKPIPTLLPGFDPKLPYDVPAGRLRRVSVYTNTVPGGHMRAPGDVQFIFAFESQLDAIARDLGIDPLEIRMRNAVRDDGSDFDGIPYLEPAAVQTLEALRAASDWGKSRRLGRGRGIALGVRHIGGGKAEVVLRMDATGRIEARTSAVEQGMGVFTVVQRVIATELDVDPTMIRVVQGPAMHGAPADPGAGASRQTHVTGGAARVAAQRLRERMNAGDAFPIEVRGTFEAAHGHGPEPHGFCGLVVEVDVDRQTGETRVVDAICVADVGTVVN
ncbi:MAG: xanthine dehydrogenase family protein molybdopterin-binding subunit, partial [Polyangiaceae bacterium]